MTRLGALAGCADARTGPGAAVPVALDRGGLRVRFTGTGTGGTFDARFAFPAPVDGVAGLRHALHALFGQAREAAGQG
ncbi:DUF2470 domain-containing protein [Streptantibioticus silvisoli]|uniref:DUF2470 domain-containing protein n=1 Tax=Streptantibioticus silvisoli TaxID=2705255 RepID=UPI0035577ABF